MKRKIILSIALILSVILVSMISSDSTTLAQQPQRFTADTGVVTLGPNQVLRVTVATGDLNGDDTASVRLRWIEYTQGVCNSGGVCKHAVASQTTTNPITLMPGEAASLDLVATTFGRGIVLSRRDVRATAAIINTLTGETVSHIIMANTEGD